MTKSRSSLAEEARELRRVRIMDLFSKGWTSHREMAEELNIPLRTFNRVVNAMKTEAIEKKTTHFQRSAFEIDKTMAGIEQTIRILSDDIDNEELTREQRREALMARLSAYRFKHELDDGRATVNDALFFIEEQKTLHNTRGTEPQNSKVSKDAISKDS